MMWALRRERGGGACGCYHGSGSGISTNYLKAERSSLLSRRPDDVVDVVITVAECVDLNERALVRGATRLRVHVVGSPATEAEQDGVMRVLGALCRESVDVVAEMRVDELSVPTARSLDLWFHREAVLRDGRVHSHDVTFDMDDASAVLCFSYPRLVSDPIFGMPPLGRVHASRFGTVGLFARLASSMSARVVRVDAPNLWDDAVAGALAANDRVGAIEAVGVLERDDDDALSERMMAFFKDVAETPSPSLRRAAVVTCTDAYVIGRAASDVDLTCSGSGRTPLAVSFAAGGTSLLDAMRDSSLPFVTQLSVSGRVPAEESAASGRGRAFEAARALLQGAGRLRKLKLRVACTMECALDLIWGVAEGALGHRALEEIDITIERAGGELVRHWWRDVDGARMYKHNVGMLPLAASDGRISGRSPRWTVNLLPHSVQRAGALELFADLDV